MSLIDEVRELMAKAGGNDAADSLEDVAEMKSPYPELADRYVVLKFKGGHCQVLSILGGKMGIADGISLMERMKGDKDKASLKAAGFVSRVIVEASLSAKIE